MVDERPRVRMMVRMSTGFYAGRSMPDGTPYGCFYDVFKCYYYRYILQYSTYYFDLCHLG